MLQLNCGQTPCDNAASSSDRRTKTGQSALYLQVMTLAVPASRIAERQTPSGGLNGRPEKLQDVCYSWWCLSALAILGRQHWIDEAALTRFILFCQVRVCSITDTLSAK